jgi:hypothetical protein
MVICIDRWAVDRLKGRNVAGGVKEPAGESMSEIVAPEWHLGSPGGHGDNVGERRVSLTVVLPENVGRRDVPRCADQWQYH